MVSLSTLVQTMFAVYRNTVTGSDVGKLQIINGGISHFFGNLLLVVDAIVD